MLIKTSENRPEPPSPTSSERLVTSIPRSAVEGQSKAERRRRLDVHARAGAFRSDRRLEFDDSREDAIVIRQYKGDRKLNWATGAFRRGWERIWAKD